MLHHSAEDVKVDPSDERLERDSLGVISIPNSESLATPGLW